MFRLYVLAFRGPSRLSPDAAHHVHESPPTMVVPLVALALLSIVGGWIGPPMIEGGHPFARWLAPVFDSATHGITGVEGAHPAGESAPHGVEAEHAAAGHGAHEVPRSTEILLMLLSVGVAGVGIWLAFRLYLQRPDVATRLREQYARVHALLLNKYWIDELYDATVVRPIHRMSQVLWRFWDEKVVDGIVNGVGYTIEGFSAVLRLFQTGFVGTYALFFTIGVAALLWAFLRM
jgi:NADH-quinone oxidoreductase subunit L